MGLKNSEEAVAVQKFKEYLRIKTVQPNPDYGTAVKFLQEYAKELGLLCQVVEPAPGKPVVIMTWIGQMSDLSAILLNSHMDVVPVFPENWIHDPFEAFEADDGKIFARGSQDMKCVGIQHLEAIRHLKNKGFHPKRSVHLTFVPDEEIGGELGMKKFCRMQEFQKLNIGFALDEGLATPDDVYPVFYAERNQYWAEFEFVGNPGHGSRFIEDTAVEKVHKFMGKVLQFREQEKQRLESHLELTDGDVTSSNITILQGGVQPNVVPSSIKITVDFRVTPSRKMDDFERMIQSWMTEAGPGISKRMLVEHKDQTFTSISPDDPWWMAFSGVFVHLNLKMDPQIFPAGTDSRFLREFEFAKLLSTSPPHLEHLLGIPAIGFSPMIHTPILLHDHNEYLKRPVFLDGIEIFVHLLKALTTVPQH
ncbi:unnamed protein product [Darwinula stevensoni]|uniref:N-acyl-aliphatic-L-amino acid amidohydrolase n=1 Tax=Darwinula stevensoni TaxID=69355 RepID=A0A7R9A8Q7_9CRUS|nr:unnamed protein product [Darwinula stevensoni]CAG0896666.1 unnamed protein product [Darwinula stevensoni]